jgi:hypothetical protein
MKGKQLAIPSEGLGDTIEKVTKATGIKKVVRMFTEATGIDCGCDERREKLNKMFRYQKVKCLEESEYSFLSTLYAKKLARVEHEQQVKLVTIYNRVFDQKKKTSNCGSCVQSLLNELEKIYNTYESK